LLRPRDGDFVYSAGEFDEILSDIGAYFCALNFAERSCVLLKGIWIACVVMITSHFPFRLHPTSPFDYIPLPFSILSLQRSVAKKASILSHVQPGPAPQRPLHHIILRSSCGFLLPDGQVDRCRLAIAVQAAAPMRVCDVCVTLCDAAAACASLCLHVSVLYSISLSLASLSHPVTPRSSSSIVRLTSASTCCSR
jgi:hypothetical protein